MMSVLLPIINDILVIIFDLFLFTRLVSLKNGRLRNRVFMYTACLFICIIYFIAIYSYHVPASVAALTVMTIPSLILFWCLSVHKDCRFLLTFCFIDTITLILAFLGRCLGVLAGDWGYICFIVLILLLDAAIWYFGKDYFSEYHKLLDVVDAGWKSMTVSSALIYFALIFFASYPYPLIDRLEYVPVYLVFCAIVISCYVVLLMSVVKTRKIHEQNLELQKERQLFQLAYTDQLTGLQNRASYMERVQKIISGRETGPLCCMMLDMNNLKKINDTKGHLAGDQALSITADTLRRVFEPGWNIVYRIGGDEFFVILKESDPQKVDALLEKLREELSLAGEKNGLSLSLAAGYTILATQDLKNIEYAINAADKRMYEDKNLLKAQKR